MTDRFIWGTFEMYTAGFRTLQISLGLNHPLSCRSHPDTCAEHRWCTLRQSLAVFQPLHSATFHWSCCWRCCRNFPTELKAFSLTAVRKREGVWNQWWCCEDQERDGVILQRGRARDTLLASSNPHFPLTDILLSGSPHNTLLQMREAFWGYLATREHVTD